MKTRLPDSSKNAVPPQRDALSVSRRTSNIERRTRESARGAFTLIELLVVIAIIAILAGLLSPALSSARTSAKKAKAQAAVNSLGIALKSFYNEYGYWPVQGAGNTTIATNATDQAQVITILQGNQALPPIGGSGSANPRGIVFFDVKSSDLAISGPTTNFIDPWKVVYKFAFDTSGNNAIQPYGASGPTVAAGFAIWSCGPDTKDENAVDASSLNKDNLTSWK